MSSKRWDDPHESSNRVGFFSSVTGFDFLRSYLKVFRKHLKNTHDSWGSEFLDRFLLPTGSFEEKRNTKCPENTVCYQYLTTAYFHISLTLHGFKEPISDWMRCIHICLLLYSESVYEPFSGFTALTQPTPIYESDEDLPRESVLLTRATDGEP